MRCKVFLCCEWFKFVASFYYHLIISFILLIYAWAFLACPPPLQSSARPPEKGCLIPESDFFSYPLGSNRTRRLPYYAHFVIFCMVVVSAGLVPILGRVVVAALQAIWFGIVDASEGKKRVKDGQIRLLRPKGGNMIMRAVRWHVCQRLLAPETPGRRLLEVFYDGVWSTRYSHGGGMSRVRGMQAAVWEGTGIRRGLIHLAVHAGCAGGMLRMHSNYASWLDGCKVSDEQVEKVEAGRCQSGEGRPMWCVLVEHCDSGGHGQASESSQCGCLLFIITVSRMYFVAVLCRVVLDIRQTFASSYQACQGTK